MLLGKEPKRRNFTKRIESHPWGVSGGSTVPCGDVEDQSDLKGGWIEGEGGRLRLREL